MTRGAKVYWRWSVRNANETCGATVIQSGNHFEARGTHSHPAEPGLDDNTTITAAVKDRAVEQVTKLMWYSRVALKRGPI